MVSPRKKLPYPKSVFFIVSNEFCERFSYYGMRTILVIYLTDILFYSEADAKIIYHSFTMFVYFFPFLGAILSDSLLGKFNTIFYVSMIYACGSVLLALTSTDPIGLPKKEFSILGLLLIAVGTGGIKPCVSAFGGDQFVLPQQELQLASFFSLFYFSINAGSLLSTFLTPILRNDVYCFGNENCFPLAFAVPGILMIISIVIFAIGRPLYKIKKPEGNVVLQVAKCVVHAISRKCKSTEKKEHWLDHAEKEYGPKLIADIKAALHVMVLYLPLPIFWALYDQQGSGWTFQAVRMDGNIGFYTILPDQMQVVNPLLILAFIPLFTYYVYPLLGKCNLLKTPLQRMVCGGFLAALAFAVSALVSIAIESQDPILPSANNIQLRIYNPSTFDVTVLADEIGFKSPTIKPMTGYVQRDITIKNSTMNVTFKFNNLEKSITIEEAHAYGLFINSEKTFEYYTDNVAKSTTGYPVVRTLTYGNALPVTYLKGDASLTIGAGNISTFEIPNPGKWSVRVGEVTCEECIDFRLGGTYTVMIRKENGTLKINHLVVTQPNSIHMAWLLPQYFIITAAEIMFSITGLEFSYSQAPLSMKSLLQACFLLTTAFGNLIIVVIESAKIFEKQSNDFFLYTGLMVVDMLIFTFMAMKYKYVDNNHSESGTEKMEPDDGIDNLCFIQSTNNVKV